MRVRAGDGWSGAGGRPHRGLSPSAPIGIGFELLEDKEKVEGRLAHREL